MEGVGVGSGPPSAPHRHGQKRRHGNKLTFIDTQSDGTDGCAPRTAPPRIPGDNGWGEHRVRGCEATQHSAKHGAAAAPTPHFWRL